MGAAGDRDARVRLGPAPPAGDLHLYSAKLAGTVGYVFVATLFFFESYSRTFFAVALGLVFLATAETLLVLLTRSRVDEHAGSILSPRRG